MSAFGGEDLDPPAFGKVFISIKPDDGVYLSTSIKDNIKNQLKKYSVAGIVPVITDLKYLYVESNTNAYYNPNVAPSAPYVQDLITTNITNYSKSSELNSFGARFKYSKYLNIIDNSHESVTSNITTVDMRRDMRASLNQYAEYEICYGNRFHIKKSEFNIKSSGFHCEWCFWYGLLRRLSKSRQPDWCFIHIQTQLSHRTSSCEEKCWCGGLYEG